MNDKQTVISVQSLIILLLFMTLISSNQFKLAYILLALSMTIIITLHIHLMWKTK